MPDEVDRQRQNGPGAPSTPDPVSVATLGRTEGLSVAGRSFTRDELVDALTHLKADLPWPPPIRRDGSIALNAETMADSIIKALDDRPAAPTPAPEPDPPMEPLFPLPTDVAP